jgi:hypothetical protein
LKVLTPSHSLYVRRLRFGEGLEPTLNDMLVDNGTVADLRKGATGGLVPPKLR